MRLTFLGASMMVTGSSYLLEIDGCKFLVDCGMFQGSRTTEALNRRPFLFDPTSIDFVLLTHAHIDHSGLLPKLCRAGFKGNIYATKATADLCRIMLPDSAHIQEFEAEIANRKGRRAGRNTVEPLYTVNDAYEALNHFAQVPYNQKVAVRPGIFVKFNDAGHILGSAIIEIWLTENGKDVKLVFSGDLGHPNQPIIKDPTYIEEADYVVVESTYGDRKHEAPDKMEVLGEIICDTVERGGNVVIPAFAVGRTQTLLYYLHELLKAGKIPDIPVFIDSPLAISATDIFIHHPQDFDVDVYKMLCEQKDNPFKLPRLVFARTPEESKAINSLQEPAIIISASGMADAGRILHHLKHNLWRPEASVLLVGYQAEGSMGRRLVEGIKRVKIMGEEVSVKAKIYNLDWFSAHADRDQLLDWLKGFKQQPSKVFIVHGEQKSSEAFAKLITDKLGLPVYIPAFADNAVLDGRESRIEKTDITYFDPQIQELQDFMENLDSDYMEFRKRVDAILAAASAGGKVNDIKNGVEKVRKFIKKTLELIGTNGTNGHK